MSYRNLALASVGIVIAMFVISAWAWGQVPPGQQVPVHWGPDGTVDRYGGKAEALLLLPPVMLGLVALFMIIPRVEPRRLNLERSRRAYGLIWLAIVSFLAVVHLLSVMAALGTAVDMVTIMYGAMGILFVVIGAVLPRVESNFHFGIRTPWTLSSDASWRGTHRLGGVLFVLLGLATFATVPTGSPELQLAVIVGGAILVTIVTMVYSYYLWKADPNKDQHGRS